MLRGRGRLQKGEHGEGSVSPRPTRAGGAGVTVGALQPQAAQPLLTYFPLPVRIAIYCRDG